MEMVAVAFNGIHARLEMQAEARGSKAEAGCGMRVVLRCTQLVDCLTPSQLAAACDYDA